MKIVEKRRIWFTLSLVVILIGLIAMPIFYFIEGRALNYDLEFSGGTMLHVNIGQTFDNNDIAKIVSDITGNNSPQIQKVTGKDEVIIKTLQMTEEQRDEVYDALKEKYNLTEGKDGDLLNFSSISPTVSGEMQVKALQALLLSSLAMLFYISFRFKDYRFGLSAVLALIHDILIMLTIYTVFRIPVNNSFIAAMLTIVGYSINDTIVIFDRLRENQPKMKKEPIEEIVNRSVNQTMRRSISTSFTTFVMIAVLYFLGVTSIKEFALPIMVGILAGTYSSIFIASPLWYTLKKYEEKKKTAKA
ncbi:MAG: protein translocase subunit SecF [Epulopiscium sp.]|nr:protein translocase subunit SecF [Candidatus Epulonipiscium sp.]